ncbi:hypothetical protein [Polaribacter sp. SA4-12]|uniref:hypothetical protein n=1 Tax=Polaribacter sp. SA4-12 TaxID=1312072 RepID=UPI0012FB9FDD|nr:hypothetical protein [Polaribacter sp. SA4-12]
MKFVNTLFLIFFVAFNFGCSEGNNCAERITVPDNVIKTSTGYTFEPSYWIDLPCDYDVTTLLDVSEVLQNFSYEMISFNFNPDTGNNTSKLEFEVALKNNNNFAVEGVPVFLMRTDGLESSENYTGNNGSCNTINANKTCTFSFTKEVSLYVEIINSVELVSVKYLLIK